MTSPSRRPSIAGAAQLVQRVEDPRDALEPLALMDRTIRMAAEDAGAPKLVESLDAIYVPRGLWRYGDPGRLLAQQLGSPGARTGLGMISGHIVQVLVNRACQEIAAGRADVIAIAGAESEHSKRRLAREGLPPGWDDDRPGEPDDTFGETKLGNLPQERAAGITDAVSCFSLCETSLRHSLGEEPAAHRRRISELYARMSQIAERNPHAWIRRAISAEEIRTPTPENRMVGYPYTKLMTSNIAVDQGAALILCSAEAADRFAIPNDKRVYLRAATEMNHTIPLSERDVLHRHPGQQIAGRRVLELAGKSAEALDYVDLYSCFPFAVQAGAEALGIGLDPVPSLTGGMTFAGGPFANYVLQTKATLVEKLRADPGSSGAIGSVGGYFGHFSYGVYSSEPGEGSAPKIEDVSAEFAALPRRAYVDDFQGSARIEAYSVAVRPAGPMRATFSALDEGGRRVWARSEDMALMEALLADEEACGREATIRDGIADFD